MADLTGMMQAAAGSAGGGGPGPDVQEVFSTTLYTGNGSTQTITNGIDLAGEGGMVWLKDRFSATLGFHMNYSTVIGTGPVGGRIFNGTAGTNPTGIQADGLQSYNSDGFTLGANTFENGSGKNFVSWTFRKAPKFFDAVTYTGTGANRTVSHNLGSVPGCIIVKRTNIAGDWQVYHRANTANPETDYLVTNSTAATVDSNTRWNDTAPTSTAFTVGTEATVNASGGTYVAYLFAHDAGGFGDDGLQNVVTCGSYTGNGSATGPTVALGYEPQWLMIKRTNSTGDWIILDSKRDVSNPRNVYLEPNTTDAEATGNDVDFNATSFQLKTTSTTVNASGGTYIYVAIRADM